MIKIVAHFFLLIIKSRLQQVAAFAVLLLLMSCAATKKNYSPAKKFSRQELQQDYTLLRNILESKHPSLYWYTPKDSMDMYFSRYALAIEDSMTEAQFGWKILAPLTHQVHCGHTSFSMSKAYTRWVAGRRFPSFPLFARIWGDSMIITGNLNRKDSLLKKGMVVTSVNGLSIRAMTEKMFSNMPADGYAFNVNYMRLGNNFPYYHRNIFGLSKVYSITYLDSTGKTGATQLPLFEPVVDTAKKRRVQPSEKPGRKTLRRQALLEKRSLLIDTATATAVMTVNTFIGGKLRRFFRRSFRTLRQQNISSLVIDLRSNGGGKVAMSSLLTRYITRVPFKVADTAVPITRTLRPYTRHIKGGWLNNLGLMLFSHRKKDGQRHFGYYERKTFYPKRNNHFDSAVYILIGGSTFSASTLLCNDVKGQQGITLVGEQAGGGWHGNTGLIIPDIILPNTKLRVRLPLVRLVQSNHVPKNGLGVMPDVYVPPSYEALTKGFDKKMQVVKELILQRKAAQ